MIQFPSVSSWCVVNISHGCVQHTVAISRENVRERGDGKQWQNEDRGVFVILNQLMDRPSHELALTTTAEYYLYTNLEMAEQGKKDTGLMCSL
jgi:hypothetical protein